MLLESGLLLVCDKRPVGFEMNVLQFVIHTQLVDATFHSLNINSQLIGYRYCSLKADWL